jgi:hypothetical protein
MRLADLLDSRCSFGIGGAGTAHHFAVWAAFSMSAKTASTVDNAFMSGLAD